MFLLFQPSRTENKGLQTLLQEHSEYIQLCNRYCDEENK